MEEMKSKVYIKIDEHNKILCCEGGYTIANIANIADWIFIDEGEGDKYNLCQSHYFDKGLMDHNGCNNYKYENNTVIEISDEEKEIQLEDIKAEIIPTVENDLMSMAVEHEYRITLLELGV